ncbi:MAG: NUDIX hydrolase [Anaerocolumna aminovalerica]|jgi:8-oxo-dGTP pyrophosphatase MutT (NUDIX family)|uniref:NUDIX hydrolase n=1 Tax=Anaerocolumna aminovalerica TaxID=1527 RepID=UPI0029147100|nr:NUDIX hydrolase [Anaerocolumna aminovalerica]MDU6266799.1 NUDIX hydrolase [Anaerocolumna aminovalerica]
MIRKAVGAIVYDNEDRYLLVHKVKVMDGKDSKIQMDSWDFVKGGIQTGENALEAVKREIWEETGCTNYVIEKNILEKLFFEFENEIAFRIGFSSQETEMFLIRYLGDKKELTYDDNEIDSIIFCKKNEVYDKLTNIETKDYWNKYFQGSLK